MLSIFFYIGNKLKPQTCYHSVQFIQWLKMNCDKIAIKMDVTLRVHIITNKQKKSNNVSKPRYCSLN